jgi:hypothetical protein
MKIEYSFSEFGRKGGEAGSFEDALAQVQTGNEGTPPPADPAPTGNEGSPAPTPVDDDIPQATRDYIAQNPDAARHAEEINRQFKAAFTPRLQDAAKLREQYEGLDPNVANAVRHLQQLIQTDPKHAAEYLRQQAVLLEGSQTPQAQPDPANVPEFATDVEEMLYKQVMELRQWQQEQTGQFQQREQQQRAVSVQQEFGKLEQEFGVQVPIEERARAWELSEATQGKLSVTDAYFALNRNTLLPTLTQKARDEASGVVQQKLGLTAPGNLATRGGAPQVEGPQDFDFYFRDLRNG